MGKPVSHKIFGQPNAKPGKAVYTVTADGVVKPKVKDGGKGYEGDFKLDLKQGDALAELSFVVKDGALVSVEAAQEGEFKQSRKEIGIDLPAVKNTAKVLIGKAILSASRGLEDVFVVRQKGTYHWIVAPVTKPEMEVKVQLVGHTPKEVGQCAFTFEEDDQTFYVRVLHQYNVKTFNGTIFPIDKMFD